MTDHVLVDPMASQPFAVLIEVQIVAVSVGQAASDMDQMVRFMGERLIGHEGQCVVVGRPLPVAGNLAPVESADMDSTELLHTVDHGVVELQNDVRTRVDADRPTGRSDADQGYRQCLIGRIRELVSIVSAACGSAEYADDKESHREGHGLSHFGSTCNSG